MLSPTKASVHTLQQVREIVDKVAKHPRLGKTVVTDILCKLGTNIARAGEVKVDDLEPKYFDRVFQRCEEVLKEQPSEKDEELIGKINDAVEAEEKATSVLTDRGVDLGKLLIEAFHRYPTERPFRAFLKWTAFTTYKRAAELMFAAGGRKEGEELQRLLKRGAENTAKSRDRNKAAITKPDVMADDAAKTTALLGDGAVAVVPRSAGNGEFPEPKQETDMRSRAYKEWEFAARKWLPLLTDEIEKQDARLLVSSLTKPGKVKLKAEAANAKKAA